MIGESIKEIDRRFNRLIEENQIPLVVQAFRSITALGSLHLTSLMIFVLWSFGEKTVARLLTVSIISGIVVIYPIKKLVKRRRPRRKIENIIGRSSFPSGHSGMAFITATILSSSYGREFFFFSLAFLVAFSRLYLEDHYLSDVVTGSTIGLILGHVLITV